MEPEKAKPAVPASEEPEPVPHFQPITTLRVTAQHFDGLLRSASGLLLEGQHQSMVTAGLKAMTNEIAQLEKEVRVERGKSAAGADALERRVRALSRQAFALRKLQQRSCWAVGALSKQLLRDVWQARMVPVEGLLEGYRKVVRDLARDEAKEMDFRTESTGAHADRGVLEALKGSPDACPAKCCQAWNRAAAGAYRERQGPGRIYRRAGRCGGTAIDHRNRG